MLALRKNIRLYAQSHVLKEPNLPFNSIVVWLEINFESRYKSSLYASDNFNVNLPGNPF